MKIKRGDVWIVNLSTDAVAQEINKKRRSVVVNDDGVAIKHVAILNVDSIGVLPLKIIVPLTKWKDHYKDAPWHIPIMNSKSNGLTIKSSADTFQVRSVSETRFIEKVGKLTEQDIERIKKGLAICLDIDE